MYPCGKIAGCKIYNGTINLTSIEFTLEEMELLNAGLQHSIEQPIKHFWNDLIIETKQAIRKLEPKSQEAYRLIAAKKLKQLNILITTTIPMQNDSPT